MYYRLLFLLLWVAPFTLFSQKTVPGGFKVVPLGVKGGSDESNLSAYMLAAGSRSEYICLDAGTLRTGIERAISAGIFKTTSDDVLKNYIKAYLISHPHLDHLAGLIINSPDDTVKRIYGLPFCLDVFKEKYFTWKSWANFANEGDKPFLNKYQYAYLPLQKEAPIEGTGMYVTAFPLSHSNPFESTAFLIRSDSEFVLYLGDTGADEIEKSDRLHNLWQQVAPLVKTGKLKGIFIEISLPNEQPAGQLFGHLTPRLLQQEMEQLASLTGRTALKDLKVLVTHIKPAGNHEAKIKAQLQKMNSLQLQFIFPRQATALTL